MLTSILSIDLKPECQEEIIKKPQRGKKTPLGGFNLVISEHLAPSRPLDR
jgi:hypothetical protein